MELKYTYNKVKVEKVTAAKLKEVGGYKNGYFMCNPSWDDPDPDVVKFLTLTFSPVIYIDKTLDPKLAKAVETHEKVHANDCKTLADNLAKEIQKVLKAKKDPKMKDRMKWFEHDSCKKSKEFHAKEVGYDVEVCEAPLDKRPN